MHSSQSSVFALPPPRPCLRRKIRKGTQSCWECKRRKIRCNFAGDSRSSCDGCKRRNTRCIRQDFAEDTVNVNGESKIHNRLDRLEIIVDQLAKKVDLLENGHDSTFAESTLEDAQGDTRCNYQSLLNLNRTDITSAVVHGKSGFYIDAHYCKAHRLDSQLSTKWRYRLMPTRLGADIAHGLCFRREDGYQILYHALADAWPSKHDFEVILNLPGDTSGLFHGIICTPSDTTQPSSGISLEKIFQLPSKKVHPVLMARKLLMLAVYLQSLSPSCARKLIDSRVNYHSILFSVFKAAQNYVTSTDSLLDSIEGIECMMMESMYENNAGNLQRAWQVVSRAMLIAQMMGLDRSRMSASFLYLDSETRLRVCPYYMWFRLIQMNRYLSMMLGLKPGVLSNDFADYNVLEHCAPIDRMQRMTCAAGGYILQRNEAGLFDAATTRMIDGVLQDSKSHLPQSWWLLPDFRSGVGETQDVSQRIVRMMDQLTHYHLVIQLHLPHIIRPNTGHGHDYSKVATLNASREILARFKAMRSAHAFASFCRGVSLLALIACVTLCVLHTEARIQLQGFNHTRSCSDHDGALPQLLANQHQRDRNLMILTVQAMEYLAQEFNDSIASKTIPILKQLLHMEAGQSLRIECITNQESHETEAGLGCGGKLSDGGRILYVHVPRIGTVKFERCDNGIPECHDAQLSL